MDSQETIRTHSQLHDGHDGLKGGDGGGGGGGGGCSLRVFVGLGRQ